MTAAAPSKDASPPPAHEAPPMTLESAAAERSERLRKREEEAIAGAKPTAHLLKALLAESILGFSENGAALFIAHMLVDLGSAKVLKMSGKDAVAHAIMWRKMHPVMWPQMMMGDTLRFVHRIAMQGTDHDTIEGYNAAIAKINPPPMPVGF
jgi:hypothetical protein